MEQAIPAPSYLSSDLRTTLTTSSGKDPILHHLNADSSWLIQIPYPSSILSNNGRKYFNILLDPWLVGPQSDVASWFSKQWHAITPAYSSIAAVNELCWGVETERGEGRAIDVVAISHEFTDHCHEQTLRELDRDTPIFANDKAITLLKSWRHFTAIHNIPAFNSDWLSTSSSPLPPFLSLSRLQSQSDFLYYHSALIIAFQPSPSEEGKCIIYTPHGLPIQPSDPFALTKPPLKTLALLHGLHDVSIPWTPLLKSGTQQLNLGAHNALKLQRQLNSKYWISTHDEVKKGGGLVGLILRRKVITLEEALDAEGEKKEGQDIKVIDMENGKAMVLV